MSRVKKMLFDGAGMESEYEDESDGDEWVFGDAGTG
jgi:hypothetical protein